MMDLRLEGREPVRVWVGGRLICEVVDEAVDTRDDLLEIVTASRVARAFTESIAPGLVESARKCGEMPGEGMKPGEKRDAWARGLRDGLAGVTELHPYSRGTTGRTQITIDGVLAETSGPYRVGYEAGKAVRNVARLSESEAPDA